MIRIIILLIGLIILYIAIKYNKKHNKILNLLDNITFIENSAKITNNGINNSRATFSYFYLLNTKKNIKKYNNKILKIIKKNNYNKKFIDFYFSVQKEILKKKSKYGFTILGKDLKNKTNKLYIEYIDKNQTIIKAIEINEFNRIKYKIYFMEKNLNIKKELKILLNNHKYSNEILKLFDNNSKTNIYKCYKSSNNLFNNLTLTALHLKITNNFPINKIFLLNLFKIINKNKNDFYRFKKLINNIKINILGISNSDNQIYFTIYYNK